jgi:hypothetical protein
MLSMSLNLKRFIRQARLRLNKRREHASRQEELRLLVVADCELGRIRPNNDSDKHVLGIIFSMDRALQLHALLGSYQDLVTHRVKVIIIYRASNQAHDAAYRQVLQEYADLVVVKRQESRQDFKPLLLDALSESAAERVFFLVDDNMFVEPVNLSTFAGRASMYCVPSLRMGKNLSRSYTQQRCQAAPHVLRLDSPNEEALQAWLWKYGELDWNYPLSVDGHFFQRHEILALAKTLNFDSPNRFEEQLQKFHAVFSWRLGVCYSKSRLINIPYNRVQTDIANIHGSVHQDEMLKSWHDGYRIDRQSYYGFVNESAHQELPLRLIRRTKGQGD